jgi:transcriptional regulator with XRE-family HTH domain
MTRSPHGLEFAVRRLIRTAVANFVNTQRMLKGWTQRDLAAASGTSKSGIAIIESKDSFRLQEPTWRAICKALDADPEKVLAEIEEQIGVEIFYNKVEENEGDDNDENEWDRDRS